MTSAYGALSWEWSVEFPSTTRSIRCHLVCSVARIEILFAGILHFIVNATDATEGNDRSKNNLLHWRKLSARICGIMLNLSSLASLKIPSWRQHPSPIFTTHKASTGHIPQNDNSTIPRTIDTHSSIKHQYHIGCFNPKHLQPCMLILHASDAHLLW